MNVTDLTNLVEQAWDQECGKQGSTRLANLTPRDLINIIGQFAWLVFNEERNENLESELILNRALPNANKRAR